MPRRPDQTRSLATKGNPISPAPNANRNRTFGASYTALAGETREAALAGFAGQNFSTFKEALSGLSVDVLGRIGGEMRRLMADPGHIDGVLRHGAERAAAIATPILRDVQDITGLLRV